MTYILQGVISKGFTKLNIQWKQVLTSIKEIFIFALHTFYQQVYKQFETYDALDSYKTKEFEDRKRNDKTRAIAFSQKDNQEGTKLEEEEIVETKLTTANKSSCYADVYQYQLNRKEVQLPTRGSSEEKILNKLVSYNSVQFKQIITALFYEMEQTKYELNKIGPAGNNGFTFNGTLQVPGQFSYEINFVGEARKRKVNDAIDSQDVSRVLSMLNGGEYGFYITTSYYTESAQIEILKEKHALKTIDGKQLVELFKELNLIKGEEINALWLKRVLSENTKCA